MPDVDVSYANFLSELSRHLRRLDFRRSGTSFFRQPIPPATNWFMVNVQTMLVPEGREFVLNYGLICPTLLASVDGWMAPPPLPGKLPKRRGTQIEWRLSPGWYERPGYNMERWWRLTPETSPEEVRQLAVEVTDGVENEALPRLQPLATDAGLRDYYLERLYEPEGWLPPIELDRLVVLLERLGQANRIATVRAEAEVRIEAADEQRWQAIADFEPYVNDLAREVLQRQRRLPGPDEAP